ncbi:MAG: YihY/virulence factor BrkB family protein [Phycisphaerales bacterium]|nr:YihY/virulence factor BrkB family protein [Phycisphaerales bacterium]
MKLKPLWMVPRDAVLDFLRDDCFVLAASLSFFTLFSLAPLLLIVIALAGLAFGAANVERQVVGQFSGLIGDQGGELIQTVINNASKGNRGVVATIVGVGTLLLGATGLFGQLKSALNTVWGVKSKPAKGVRAALRLVRVRLLSFAMVLVVAFLLLVSLLLSAGLAALGEWTTGLLPAQEGLLRALNAGVSFLILTLLFAATFKLLPDARIGWREVWLGAAITSALFTLGKYLIGLYLGRDTLASVYGAAGSLIIVLMWVYYSALILLLGAEFTQITAHAMGKDITPSPEGRLRDACEPGSFARDDPASSVATSQRDPHPPGHDTTPPRPGSTVRRPPGVHVDTPRTEQRR